MALQVLKARWNLWKLRRVSRLKEMEKDKKLRKVAPAGSGGNFWNGAYDEREDIAKECVHFDLRSGSGLADSLPCLANMVGRVTLYFSFA